MTQHCANDPQTMDRSLKEFLPEEFFLTNSFGDRYLYSLNHNTLNQTGALLLHRSRLDRYCEKRNTLFIVIGSDSGTLLPFLASKEIAPGSQFLLLEPASIHRKIQNEYSSLQLPKNIIFGSDEEFQPLTQSIETNRFLYAGEVVLIKSLAAEYGFLSAYHELFFTVQNWFTQQQWQINARLQGQPFIHAQLDNLADNLIPSTLLKDTFQGKTAVLLAGGPSLDEVLPWVKENRSSLAVLAVSRICRRLLEVDLHPDFIFSIDPHRVSFDVSLEMLHFWQDSIFIHSHHVSPLLLGQWRGKSIFLGNRFPWKTEMNKPSLPMPGPTVSNIALSVATEMGFSQIVLAGLDLCHSKDGYTHAMGSNERTAGPQIGVTSTQVTTNGGWMAETTSDFLSAINFVSAQAQNALQKNIQLINPSAGSAKIDHVLHCPLETIKLEAYKENPALSIDRLMPVITGQERVEDLQAVRKELVKAKAQLVKIHSLCKKALRCNDGLFGRKGIRQDFKYKKEMDKIEKKLNTTYSDHSVFLKNYAAYQLLQMAKYCLNYDDCTDEEIENSTKEYYTSYSNASKKLINILNKHLEKIQFRIDECDQNTSFDYLASQWENDELPGRLYIWIKRHNLKEQDLPSSYKKKLDHLILQYEKQFTKTLQSSHMQRSTSLASLEGVRGKIQLYFTKNDKDSLQFINESLKNHKNPQAKKYLILSAGMIAELEGNTERALHDYQLLLDEQNEVLREDALCRLAVLFLSANDPKNSLITLEALSKISSAYIMQYGDLLRLLGQSQSALTTYLDYLEKVPQDTIAMLKIGNYFKDLQIFEGARELYQHVLLLEPDNQTANFLLHDLEQSRVN